VPAAGNQMLLEDEPRADEGAAEVDGELGVQLGPGGGGWRVGAMNEATQKDTLCPAFSPYCVVAERVWGYRV
jgi:hypothetical protein